jgi:ABC-type sugar transport system ATPase subunit
MAPVKIYPADFRGSLSHIEIEHDGRNYLATVAWEGRRAWGHVGRHVVLGIRPEHLYLRMNGPAEVMAELPAVVNVIEPLGSATDVYMETNLQQRVVGRFEALEASMQVGSRVSVYADQRRIHLFEPGETGMNLSLSNESSHALA